uniref:EOG090X0AKT n=1 Tax=Daphnia longispina TaxID=42846 RepID=A0A4Y7M5N8_9CRUS|nr:EOG090X0AKT [Daphnia longispina]
MGFRDELVSGSDDDVMYVCIEDDIQIIAPMETIPGNPDVIEIGDDANDAELSDDIEIIEPTESTAKNPEVVTTGDDAELNANVDKKRKGTTAPSRVRKLRVKLVMMNFLRQEFNWLIKNEVHKVFNQLKEVLEAAARRYPVEIAEVETQVRQEKYVMATSTQTSQDQLKCILTITGDSITSADMTLKLHKHPNVVYHTTIAAESPWRLQQIQDSGNYLRMALSSLSLIPDQLQYLSAEEVLNDLDLILGKVNRARSTLAIPRKRTIDELMNSKNMKTLTPSLPSDLAVSFYLQAHKLIFAVYHLTQAGGTVKFETLQSESPVTWLNEVLVLLSVALHRAQQLRDKVSVFLQYQIHNVSSGATTVPIF